MSDTATEVLNPVDAERKIQDYRSTYNDVRDWLRRENSSAEKDKSTDFDFLKDPIEVVVEGDWVVAHSL